jgi:L-threonylcarbamoyladenylate synthase
MSDQASNQAAIDDAVRALEAGFLVVFPTDTVYGVAAHSAVPGAREKIYAAKRRDDGKPLQILVANVEAAVAGGAVLGSIGILLAKEFWPGAMTMVVDVGESTEGLRMPDHPTALALLGACGGRLYASSANVSGESPATSASEAAAVLGPDVRAVLDFGPAPLGTESTVVRIENEQLTILREGAITRDEIERCLRR